MNIGLRTVDCRNWSANGAGRPTRRGFSIRFDSLRSVRFQLSDAISGRIIATASIHSFIHSFVHSIHT